MTTGAIGDERPTLFLRKATGLVRGWSIRDSMIYACLSTNVVTLGLTEFAGQDAFPRGQLLTAVLISGVWVSFLVVTYSGLVVTLPRAGGDYVWQSRILGSGLGFVMAATGWWFILLLWPNRGTTLYGEVHGAGDFRRVFRGMFTGLWLTVILSVIFLALFAKTFGYGFYQDANATWLAGTGLPVFPYPALLAGWLVHNTAFQVILILLMSLWFFGWVGTLFLSSTRVIFAAAFDRILPDGAARVSDKHRVPAWSLMLMLLPAVGLAALQAYNSTFHAYTRDAMLVIAVTYLFSAIAVVVLPFRRPALWSASPASRIEFLGIPAVPACGVITIGLLGYSLYEWLSNGNYGVNNNDSLIYMGAMYVLALGIYLGARAIRRRQGIDLSLIDREIPAE
jgi:basic amino acid/polyamine antiporter, APA family